MTENYNYNMEETNIKTAAIENLEKRIFDFSGLKVSPVQMKGFVSFLNALAEKNGLCVDDYCNQINHDSKDFTEIINYITVNETYFFREEKQFDMLAKEVFPKFAGKKMNVWSAASSSGEEAISLLVLAKAFNVDAQVFATDIDENTLKKFEKGEYTRYSFRTDGKKYHDMLLKYFSEDNDRFTLNQSILSKIRIKRYNLKSGAQLPFSEKMDLIFLRNVFIYFDRETRRNVTARLCSCLNDGGYLFFSMNEIGCIDSRITPPEIYKTSSDSVFYYRKGDVKRNDDVKPSRADAKTARENGKITEKSEQKRLSVSKPEINMPMKKIGGMDGKFEKDDLLKKSVLIKKDDDILRQSKKDSLNETKNDALKNEKWFVSLTKELHDGNFSQVKMILENVHDSVFLVYKFFFQGYAAYFTDDKILAEKMFASAELVQSDFWPAYFYHGLVLRDVGKTEACLKCLKKCMSLLENCGEKENVSYDFLLDSFSAGYVNSVCKSILGANEKK